MFERTFSKNFTSRWSTLTHFMALILFIVSATIVEYLIVVYAINIGVRDEACFKIPYFELTVSPLFHIVPASTIILLAACWTCMTKYIVTRSMEKVRLAQKKQRAPSGGLKAKINGFKYTLLKVRALAYIIEKLNDALPMIKSALIVLLCFLAFAFLTSMIASPWLVYRSFANLYRGNPQIFESIVAFNSALHCFIKSVPPIALLCSTAYNTLNSAAPAIRDFASSLGALTKPLVDLSPVGKYLIYHNLAAWISALAILTYGTYVRKSYRYRKAKKV